MRISRVRTVTGLMPSWSAISAGVARAAGPASRPVASAASSLTPLGGRRASSRYWACLSAVVGTAIPSVDCSGAWRRSSRARCAYAVLARLQATVTTYGCARAASMLGRARWMRTSAACASVRLVHDEGVSSHPPENFSRRGGDSRPLPAWRIRSSRSAAYLHRRGRSRPSNTAPPLPRRRERLAGPALSVPLIVQGHTTYRWLREQGSSYTRPVSR